MNETIFVDYEVKNKGKEITSWNRNSESTALTSRCCATSASGRARASLKFFTRVKTFTLGYHFPGFAEGFSCRLLYLCTRPFP